LLHDVSDPDKHPCLYEGDGEDAEDKQIYMKTGLEGKKILVDNTVMITLPRDNLGHTRLLLA